MTHEAECVKKKIGNQNVLYPAPVTVVGALVNGKVNFLDVRVPCRGFKRGVAPS
jgi:hypothetical protein